MKIFWIITIALWAVGMVVNFIPEYNHLVFWFWTFPVGVGVGSSIGFLIRD